MPASTASSSSGAGKIADVRCGRKHTVLLADNGSVWSWDLSHGRGGTTARLFHRQRDKKKVTKSGPNGKPLGPRLWVRVLRWNPRDRSVVIAGHDDGSLTIFDTERGKITEKLIPPEGSGGKSSLRGVEVTDVQWDALSSPSHRLI